MHSEFMIFGGALCLLAMAGMALLFLRAEKLRKSLQGVELQLASNASYTAALEARLKEIAAERDAALGKKEEIAAGRQSLERELVLAREREDAMRRRMEDWESHRREFIKMAEASVLEAGGKISSKLMEDHQREREAAEKRNQEVLSATTGQLQEKFLDITRHVAALGEQTKETRTTMATVWRALTSPGGAGQMAEIGLENTLKNLGLEPGRDFAMQYVIAAAPGGQGGGLRPDAVLFLPQDTVMVIDSKASIHFMELAQAEGQEREAEALAALMKRMRSHVADLTRKDYQTAIQKAAQEAGRAGAIRQILNVMYLPSESAIERLRQADAAFFQKAAQDGIIIAGPASLAGLFSLARLHIGAARQAENQEVILRTVEDLAASFAVALGYASKLGGSLKSAMDQFGQFAASFNARVLPKLRRLSALGVKPPKGKALPGRMAFYEVHLVSDALTLEAQDVDEIREIEEEPAAQAERQSA